jgi:hypothetical protein
MFEIVFVLAAVVVVFGLFFLVFFIKQKSDGNKIHTCAQCNCERNKNRSELSRKALKERQGYDKI